MWLACVYLYNYVTSYSCTRIAIYYVYMHSYLYTLITEIHFIQLIINYYTANYALWLHK